MDITIGRMIHVVEKGKHLPAVVTNVFSNTLVNARVFCDTGRTQTKLVGVTFDSKGKDNTWHWPEGSKS